ncbi:MAG: thioredoxin domain-containing protein [Deltaproteobacteria bacterium]|nr:thioredoxin domain-containing protein [Deltaproteobacteria bacterium]
MKKLAGMLLICGLLSGCNAPKPEMIQEEALKAIQAHPEIIKEQVLKTIRENPEVMMDVLKEKNIEVLQIVEKGSRDLAEKKRDERLKLDLANPKNPKIDLTRPFIGDPDAPITIVEYSDFQCFYCGKAAGTVQDLVKKYPKKIRVFFKHMPFHEMSKIEAMYFESIARQSMEKAWKFHDIAFDRREDILKEKESGLQDIVNLLGVDDARLKKDLESKELSDMIGVDLQEARSFGFDATPSFLINGVSLVGAVPFEEFEKVIRLIEEKK